MSRTLTFWHAANTVLNKRFHAVDEFLLRVVDNEEWNRVVGRLQQPPAEKNHEFR